ncbi:Ig-like domain-containing protein [Halorientalis pallida]|uniref:Cadherin domain-containing protein n=1 Tax=Halorientalis pallida TaxID=2479928 RepID=A0A498KX23_9EURY|nr:Ig-like domain-containing protein [Halorientalis pallida]RXK50162.1 hypothetical protein EAF64_06265 [Halorientalis pallida]
MTGRSGGGDHGENDDGRRSRRPVARRLVLAVALGVWLCLIVSATALAASGDYAERTGDDNPADGVDVTSTAATADVIAGDFDNDGDPDLLAYDGSAERYYENDGGRFVERSGDDNPFAGVGQAFGTRTGVFVTDVDGDDDADVIAFEPATDSLRWLENTDGQTYVERTGADNPFAGIDVSGSSGTVDAVVGDFDDDGDPDLLAYDGSAEHYYENDGGTFTERTKADSPFAGVQTAFWTRSTTLVRDFDDDGDDDVAWKNGTTAGWHYVERTDDGYVDRTSGSHPLSAVSASATDASLAAIAADFDADGAVELLADDGSQRYYDRGESDDFTAVSGDGNPFSGVDPAFGVYGTTLTVDADGDTDVDLLLAADDGLRYLERTGSPAPPAFGATGPFTVDETASVGTVVGDVDATAGEGGAPDTGVSYAITGGNGSTALAVDATTGAITVADADTLDHDSSRRLTLDVSADDGTETTTTTITVEVADATPSLDDRTLGSIDEDAPSGAAIGTVTATGDTTSVAYAITGGNPDRDGDGTPAFTLDERTGRLTVADADDVDHETADQERLTVTATDGTASATAVVGVTVKNVNEAPEAIDREFGVESGATLSVSAAAGLAATATDPDGDTLTASTVREPTSGTLRLRENGSFRYTPEGGFSGTDAFTYAVTDGNGATARATATITVEQVRDVAGSGSASFAVDLDAPSAPVATGEAATVMATVANTGSAAGTRSVTLSIDRIDRATEAVSLDAGESTTVTFEWVAGADDVGQRLVRIETGEDYESAYLVVEERTATPTDTATTRPATDSGAETDTEIRGPPAADTETATPAETEATGEPTTTLVETVDRPAADIAAPTTSRRATTTESGPGFGPAVTVLAVFTLLVWARRG